MTLEEQIAQNIFDKYERKDIDSPYIYQGRKKYDTAMQSTELIEYRNVLTLDTPALTEEELTLLKQYEDDCESVYKSLDNHEIDALTCNQRLEKLNIILNESLKRQREEEPHA